MGNLGSSTKHSGVPPHSLDKSKRLAEPDDGGIVAVKYTPDGEAKQTILVVGPGGVNKMTIWNRKTTTWTVSRMELPRLPVGVVYLDDELYLINWDKPLSKLDKNMELKQLADMNEKRGYINNSCLEWNGYIWVFGGNNLKSVERYDPKEDKWALVPDMKYVRSRAAAPVCNGKIYICGGIGDDNVDLKSVECFDPESEVWTELTDMPTPRDDHSAGTRSPRPRKEMNALILEQRRQLSARMSFYSQSMLRGATPPPPPRPYHLAYIEQEDQVVPNLEAANNNNTGSQDAVVPEVNT